MNLQINPTGAQSIAQSGQLNLSVQYIGFTPTILLQDVNWDVLTPATATAAANIGNICKNLAAPAGFGVAQGISTQVILGDTYGAIQCIAPSLAHWFALASPTNNLRFGFRFLPPTQVEIMVGGTVAIPAVTCVPGQTCRIEINDRVVTWYVAGVNVHQEGPDAANECWYKAFADLSAPGTCLSGCQIESARATPRDRTDCVTWSASGGTLTQGVGGNTVWIAPQAAGAYSITASAIGVLPDTIEVTVTGVVFGTNICGGTVAANSLVEFPANGGTQATLTADGGTVIDATHWLAPGVSGIYNLTYSNNGGSQPCQITVVPQLEIAGVSDGLFDSIFAGQCHQFVSNLSGTVFSSTDGADRITSQGYFCAPDDAATETFGAHSYTVTAVNGNQSVTFSIIIDPIYPGPDVEGPTPVKWTPQVPKYATRSQEGDLLCRQYTSLSSNPERRWNIEYTDLPYCPDNTANATSTLCLETSLPRQSLGTHHYAQRLDLFWDLVNGEGFPFWFRDRDGVMHQYVHFVTMTRDHDSDNYDTGQRRKVELVASPCCNEVLLPQTC